MPIGSFFGRDRRAGQELNLTLSDGSTAKGYANLSVSVDPNGNPVAGAGTSVTSGQTIVAATATIIVAARADRRSVTIVQGGNADIFLGGPTVTTTTGLLLLGTKGSAVTLDTTAAVYGIVATATQPVSFAEVH